MSLPIAILISGTGSNLDALIKAQTKGLAIRIAVVISNTPNASGLHYAQQANIPTAVIDHTHFATRQAFDSALMTQLQRYPIDLIVLAGFMRKLTPTFVHSYYGKMINLHPALLPKFRGLNTFSQALAANETEHGSSVHFVSANVDAGPIISQSRFYIEPNDTIHTLKDKTKALEHQLLPATIKLFAEQRIRLQNTKVYLDHTQLPPEGTDLTQII